MRPDGPPPPVRRVLLAAPSFAGRDGISRVAAAALRAAAEWGIPVEAWALHDGPAGSPAARVRGARGSKMRFAAWGLAAGRRSAEGTVALALHLHLAPALLPLARKGARLAVYLHGIEAWEKSKGLRARALRRADLLLAGSAYTARRFAEANPGLAVVLVCPPGVPPVAAVRTRTAPPVYALIVARMDPGERYKGHDLLLDLWPRVRERHPRARLVVAGDGPDRPRLESRARGLGEAVHFAGSVDDAALEGLYADCSFLVLPSTGEGFGLVLLEAMRAGRACIAGKGAPEEVVVHGETGLVVDPRSPTEVLAALERLLSDPDEARRMGVAGARRWAARFTGEAFARRLREALGI